MPKFAKPLPPSPARERLARLITARTEAAAEAQEAQSRIARLTALADAAAPVRAKLAALDSASAHAFSEWAKGDPSAPPPAQDTAARIDLAREIAAAQASADAAARAADGVRHEVESARAKSAKIEREIEVAASVVALEELEPIAAAAREVMTKLASARMQGQALVRVLGDATGPDRPEYNAAYAAVSEELRVSFEVPRISDNEEYAFLAKIGRLRAALHVDASARLED